MMRLGLSAADLRTYHQAIVDTHERRIEIQVLDLEENVLRSLTPKILDGQVMIDVDQTPSRILDLRFLDPSRSLDFEPDSPSDAPLHRSRMLRVIDSRRVTALNDWINCDVFRGVIWNFERNGAEVSLVCHGKEQQAMGAKWSPRTFAAKSKKSTAIRELMTGTGEQHLSVPNLSVTFPKRFTVGRLDPIWPKAKKVATSMNRRLFYNGAGQLRMRPYSSRPVYTFWAALLSEVEIKRDTEELINVVEVMGANPKGPKKRVSGIAQLPSGHPLSPARLGRNGAWLRLVKRVENDHFKTKAECLAHAKQIRDDSAKTITDFGFDSLPIPHLEEGDMVAIKTDQGRLLVRLRQWSIPLSPDAAPMTVGSLKRTTRAGGRAAIGYGK